MSLDNNDNEEIQDVDEVLKNKPKAKKNKNKEDKPRVDPHTLISSSEIESIRRSLIETDADLVVKGMLDEDVRIRLADVVRKGYKRQTGGNEDVIDYIVRETIGTGVIEEILKDESITDIGYNGSELIIESNDRKQVFDTDFEISDNYIIRLVNKFANANDKEFTAKNPIFDGRFDNVRINAVHAQNTAPESGTTMALRVVRPRLALTKDNFEGFAPMFMLDFFEAAALTRSNMVISGTTGTGKTELHKLISGFIPFDDRILLIEDTPETFMKQMFPEKDVFSWVSTDTVTTTELIKAGLRNHPAWIMVTETRGSEAYEMIQAVLSGHSIITSLHATDARAIPSRFINMSKMGYDLSEDALAQDIRLYFQFGIHIKKISYNGMIIRFLHEVIEFNVDGDITIFKQQFLHGVFKFETFELSDEFKLAMEESMVDLDFPENFRSERPLNSEDVSFKSSIPLDETGRPDHAKLKKMGTSIEEVMGQTKPVHIVADEPVINQPDTNQVVVQYVQEPAITPTTQESQIDDPNPNVSESIPEDDVVESSEPEVKPNSALDRMLNAKEENVKSRRRRPTLEDKPVLPKREPKEDVIEEPTITVEEQAEIDEAKALAERRARAQKAREEARAEQGGQRSKADILKEKREQLKNL